MDHKLEAHIDVQKGKKIRTKTVKMACDFDPYDDVNQWRKIHPMGHAHLHRDEKMTDEEHELESFDWSVHTNAKHVHDTHFAYIDDIIDSQEFKWAHRNENKILDKHHGGEMETLLDLDDDYKDDEDDEIV